MEELQRTYMEWRDQIQSLARSLTEPREEALHRNVRLLGDLRDTTRQEDARRLRDRLAIVGIPAPPEEGMGASLTAIQISACRGSTVGSTVNLGLPECGSPFMILEAWRVCGGCHGRLGVTGIASLHDLGDYLVAEEPFCERCEEKRARRNTPEALTLAALGRIEGLLKALVDAEEYKAGARKASAA